MDDAGYDETPRGPGRDSSVGTIARKTKKKKAPTLVLLGRVRGTRNQAK